MAAKNWPREGARVLAFRAPRWEGLNGTPFAAAMMTMLAVLYGVALQRTAIVGPATFYWTGLLNGWLASLLSIWMSWIVVRSAPGEAQAPDVGTLVTLQIAATFALTVIDGVAFLALRFAFGDPMAWPLALRWATWLLPAVWGGLSSLRLLWRITGAWRVRAGAVLVALISLAIAGWAQPMIVWWPDRTAAASKDGADEDSAADDDAGPGLVVDETVLAIQPRVIDDALKSLPASQPDRVNVYAVTYAPYESEDVFMNESEVVARTMAERFGAGGRTVQLVLNKRTSKTLPWATQANLRRTIDRMASLMDREKDVLFLHLTSHGGKDASLATMSWPLKIDPVTPALIKQWLDEAGIRWRVISVSACYSGSWIAPLAGDGTLVMTAADADHTSFGCGSRSPLTFFGQAMYVDALKDSWSFSEAHAKARQLIEVREKEAGKKDGYSNPQISEGAAIREVLRRLEAERQAAH